MRKYQNTASFHIKYRTHPIYFSLHFSILGNMPQPILTQANRKEKEVRGLKTRKRAILNEHARRQEAKFLAMIRAAEPGKRCLK